MLEKRIYRAIAQLMKGMKEEIIVNQELISPAKDEILDEATHRMKCCWTQGNHQVQSAGRGTGRHQERFRAPDIRANTGGLDTACCCKEAYEGNSSLEKGTIITAPGATKTRDGHM